MWVRLKELREVNKLSQKRLGIKVGISQQVISRIERDMDTATLRHLLVLADFFRVTTDYMLGVDVDVKVRCDMQKLYLGTDTARIIQIFDTLGLENKEIVVTMIEKLHEQEKKSSQKNNY